MSDAPKLKKSPAKGDKPRYQTILESAGIVAASGVLAFHEDHKTTILRRLVGALGAILDGLIKEKKDEFSNSRLYGINQCLHLASSVALLVGDDQLAKVRETLESDLVRHTGTDASTLITVATLAYLLYMAEEEPIASLPIDIKDKLARMKSRVPNEKAFVVDEWASHLRTYLIVAHWLVGQEVESALGLGLQPVRQQPEEQVLVVQKQKP